MSAWINGPDSVIDDNEADRLTEDGSARSGHGPQVLTQSLVWLIAAATGASAANLYYAQPLLHTIGRSFHAGPGTAGLIVTSGQIGYATGLALVVPLGDMVDRRRLVTTIMLATAAGMAASALAFSIWVLIALAFLVGVGSVAAQILIPLTASLAEGGARGKVIGTVAGGLLMGILLARTVSGLLTSLGNWRLIYWVAAGLMTSFAVVMYRCLAPEPDRPAVGYRRLLGSTIDIAKSEPLVRRRTLYGALNFAAFGIFWTTLAFMVSGAPYHYNELEIGLFGLVGAAGAICASMAGRLADAERTRLSSVCFSGATAASFCVLFFGRHHLVPLIVGIVLLDVGIQGLHITNQSLVFAISEEARNRLNAVYMVGYFLGGAAGSAAGALLYAEGGWTAICVGGATCGLLVVVLSLRSGLSRHEDGDRNSLATGSSSEQPNRHGNTEPSDQATAQHLGR